MKETDYLDLEAAARYLKKRHGREESPGDVEDLIQNGTLPPICKRENGGFYYLLDGDSETRLSSLCNIATYGYAGLVAENEAKLIDNEFTYFSRDTLFEKRIFTSRKAIDSWLSGELSRASPLNPDGETKPKYARGVEPLTANTLRERKAGIAHLQAQRDHGQALTYSQAISEWESLEAELHVGSVEHHLMQLYRLQDLFKRVVDGLTPAKAPQQTERAEHIAAEIRGLLQQYRTGMNGDKSVESATPILPPKRPRRREQQLEWINARLMAKGVTAPLLRHTGGRASIKAELKAIAVSERPDIFTPSGFDHAWRDIPKQDT